MQYLSSVYFVSQLLHVSGIFVAHRQEIYCMYTAIGMCCAFQLTDSEQCNIHTDKDRITHAATLPNYPHQCILIDHFNKCNFSKIK